MTFQARTRAALPALAALSFGGCAPALNHVSAWKVNCPPDRVQVADVHTEGAVTTWTASCNGHTHHCRGVEADGSQATLEQVACEAVVVESRR